MKHLWEMTLDELLNPQGHACSCGRVHRCGLKMLRVGKGAVDALPEALAATQVQRPFVVANAHTYQAAGQKVEEVLQAAGIPYTLYRLPGDKRIEPDEWAMGSLTMGFDPRCDGVLAVGSGVINDCCKVLAHACGLPSLVVCTAPSMDGYASNSSSMVVRRVKESLYNACPQAILADTDVLKTAPEVMLQAGLGDMLAKYVSVCEWRISHLVAGDAYCEEIAGLVRASLRKIVEHAEGLMRREDAALEAVIEGLVLSGVAMAFAEISRPASGLEHYFSHMWEMKALREGTAGDLHGIQVGVGTLLTLWIYEHLLNFDTVDRAKAERAMAAFDPVAWEAQCQQIFGPIAPQIIALEAKAHKNDPRRHGERLDRLCAYWPQIRQIIAEELPPREKIYALMQHAGMPLSPRDLGLTGADTAQALVGSRDIRDKYLTSSMLWDLGLLEQAAKELQTMVDAGRL